MPCFHRYRLPHRHRFIVQLRLTIGPGQGNQRVGMELQHRPLKGELQPGRRFVVTDNAVRQAEGKIIHRAGRRHADIPVALTARIILHAAPGAGLQYFNHWRLRHHAIQHPRPGGAADKRLAGGNLPQVVEVSGDAVQSRGVKRRRQFCQRRRAGWRMDNQLGDHRIVKRGDFAAGGHAGINAHIVREDHFGQDAGARLEVF